MKPAQALPSLSLPLLVASLLLAPVLPAQAGGGGSGGNGQPKKSPAPQVLTTLPARAEFETLITGISREFPTVGRLLDDTVTKYEAGTYHLHASPADDPNEWAHSSSRQRAPHSLPTEATTLLWSSFYTLPIVDDQAPIEQFDHHSQVETLLHEMMHVLFTEDDHDRAERITRPLYQLGRGQTLTPAQLRALSKDLGDLSAFEKHSDYLAALPFYLKARNVASACADFGRTPTMSIGGRALSFPTLPPGHAERFYNDPFYGHYRESCLFALPQGYLLKQYVSFGCTGGTCMSVDRAGIFREPLFLGRLVEYISGLPLRIVVSEDGIGLANSVELQNRLFQNSGANHGQVRTVTEAELERVLPGYSSWKALYLSTNPDALGQDNFEQHLEVDWFQIVMLPLRGLNSALQTGGELKLRSGAASKPGYGVTFETDRGAAACRVLSASGDSVQNDLAQPVRLRCRFAHKSMFGSTSTVDHDLALDQQQMWDYWRKNPHDNSGFTGGKASMLDDYYGLILEL